MTALLLAFAMEKLRCEGIVVKKALLWPIRKLAIKESMLVTLLFTEWMASPELLGFLIHVEKHLLC